MRGLSRGREEARDWATKTPGGVQQTVLIEELRQAGNRILVDVRRDWRWEESNELAYADELAWLFEFRNAKVLSWRPYEDKEAAEAAFTA